jgi:hypothetical protein
MTEEARSRVHCNRCGDDTFHRLLIEKTLWGWFEEPTGDYIDHPDQADWTEQFELFQCLGCEDVCLRVSRWDSEMPPDVVPETHFYPPRVFRRQPKWLSELPRDLQGILEEVYGALAADSRRLAAMGVRAAVDTVLSHKVGEMGGFAQRLQELEKVGFVGRADREHLAAVVDMGNAAAHRTHAPSADDLTHAIDILENVLRSAYQLADAACTIRKNTPRRYPHGV